MATTKKPQDFKQKADKATPEKASATLANYLNGDGPKYQFTLAGKTWDLPYAAPFTANVKGGIVRRATANPDDKSAQVALSLAMIEQAAPPDLLAILDDMPFVDMLAAVEGWMQWSPDGEEPVGESSGSEG